MDQFYSGSVDEKAPWNPIVIASDSDSDTSIDGGVRLSAHTPSSADFSLHEGSKHDCLPESFPGGNRLEAWFKGVYGKAEKSCDSSTDSESSCYYDANSELNSLLDSDSKSSDSVVNSAMYEWNPQSGSYTSDPDYGSDSDPDHYIWDSDLGSYTSDSDSDDRESSTSSDTSGPLPGPRPVGYRTQ